MLSQQKVMLRRLQVLIYVLSKTFEYKVLSILIVLVSYNKIYDTSNSTILRQSKYLRL